MTSEDAAMDVLARHWDGFLPVDPIKLATAAGVVVYGRDAQEASAYPYSGRYMKYDGNPSIEYNTMEPLARQRYIVAHVLGHIVLGHNVAAPEVGAVYASGNPEDEQANRFAAELLMPASLVRRHYESDGDQSVEKLAQLFGVSKDAMGYRLMSLFSMV